MSTSSCRSGGTAVIGAGSRDIVPAKYSNPFWKQEQDAFEILARNDIETKEAVIVRTGAEAILFAQGSDGTKRAYTAWLESDGRRILRLDPGFPALYD